MSPPRPLTSRIAARTMRFPAEPADIEPVQRARDGRMLPSGPREIASITLAWRQMPVTTHSAWRAANGSPVTRHQRHRPQLFIGTTAEDLPERYKPSPGPPHWYTSQMPRSTRSMLFASSTNTLGTSMSNRSGAPRPIALGGFEQRMRLTREPRVPLMLASHPAISPLRAAPTPQSAQWSRADRSVKYAMWDSPPDGVGLATTLFD